MSLYDDQNALADLISGSVFDAASTTQKNPVGKCARFDDGRAYRYCKAQDTIVAGNLCVATPNEQDVAVTYFGADSSTAPAAGYGGAIGDTIVQLTDDVTGITLNEYAGGYLLITDGTGEGKMYRIKGNAASATDTVGFSVEIYKPGILVALDNTSVGTMIQSPWSNVDHHTKGNYNGTATEFCVGIAMVAATVGQFLWVQTWGPAIVLAGAATMIQGATIQVAEDVDGTGQVPVATENLIQVIGVGMEAAANTIYGPVFLQITP